LGAFHVVSSPFSLARALVLRGYLDGWLVCLRDAHCSVCCIRVAKMPVRASDVRRRVRFESAPFQYRRRPGAIK